MRTALLLAVLLAGTASAQQPSLGYYRFPAIVGDTIVFTAEGDLWRVDRRGGVALRLTTHAGEETHAAISPDGRTIAYTATYEGPAEVYTMALGGGPPTRRTYEGANALVVGWTPDGRVLYSTRRYSTLPNAQLATIDLRTNASTLVPLAQAADGDFDRGGTLFFTRLPFQGSYTKRYQGGTAQNIWKLASGASASVPMTPDHPGGSHTPMVWQDRVYFASDRDGHMNLWSMNADGRDLRQHTRHEGFDIQSPALGNGRIVYQLGADLRVFDIASGADQPVPITLASDFEHTRERWLQDPVSWIASSHLSPNGDRIVLTARGQVYVVPARQGRVVTALADKRVRARQAVFAPDGRSLVLLTDQSGELEFWRAPANGIGETTQLTNDAKVLRWEGIPSPDGRWLAHRDKDQQLWILDLRSGRQTRIGTNPVADFSDLAWSPDSRWLAYSAAAPNLFNRIFIHSVESGRSVPVTSDRYDSYNATWSPDGKWLWFLTDRNLQTVVGSPWGARQPEPYFDRQTMIMGIALVPGARSPFRPDDELARPGASDSTAAARDSAARRARGAAAAPPVTVTIDFDGIQQRLIQVPLPAGNYRNLATDGRRFWFNSAGPTRRAPFEIRSLAIDNDGAEPEVFLAGQASFELSLDRKKILIRREDEMFVVDAAAKAPAPAELAKLRVPLSGLAINFDPRDEWRQMFVDAWRLERDYFYDRAMHGVDWMAIRERYAPLVERVTDRAELSDVVAQMVGELSALHIFVRGGDLRRGADSVTPASLGARLVRDDRRGGYRVEKIYRSDPDLPTEMSPLAAWDVDVREGDIIERINGARTLDAPEIGALLRNQAGRQVLLRVLPARGGAAREVVVTPITQAREFALRYTDWEYSRRLAVEERGGGRIGYVHLRAMGGNDMNQWAREYYPVFDREALIIDARHNKGGNIDSWILGRLLRRPWFYWQPRVGEPTWNMQYAFRGHMVILVNERTASDGEALAEGFRRLGLGKVIGTRTWGGEIWLSASNFLVDRGIATAAETGVYGPEGEWLIEGHGVDPDIVVDNEPAATFRGEDAQLMAAIRHLETELAAKPVVTPRAPVYPDKAPGKRGEAAPAASTVPPPE